MDTDNNGCLSAEELFPIIEEMFSVIPWAITMDHCERFCKKLDEVSERAPERTHP